MFKKTIEARYEQHAEELEQVQDELAELRDSRRCLRSAVDGLRERVTQLEKQFSDSCAARKRIRDELTTHRTRIIDLEAEARLRKTKTARKSYASDPFSWAVANLARHAMKLSALNPVRAKALVMLGRIASTVDVPRDDVDAMTTQVKNEFRLRSRPSADETIETIVQALREHRDR